MAMDDDMQTFRPRIITNGDKIRAMTDLDLAKFIVDIMETCFHGDCDFCKYQPFCGDGYFSFIKWLERKEG